ncbi:MAG: pyridoxal phosphate-dependent aminotransferase family protein [Bacteroidia bacterium]|nr:pyridoxal phosphate-dependent aminotransferase family protein [Bacteroidia bacterium]
MFSEKKLQSLLSERSSEGLLRSLRNIPETHIDFSSNDYLGFSKKGILKKTLKQISKEHNSKKTGSGGSRLLAGNSLLAEEIEQEIAAFHNAESALIFNSGYDANLGFFSAVPQKNDLIFYDELVHASIRDGMRLSNAHSYKFSHNDLYDLKNKISLQNTSERSVFIVVESVYSMDGDFAPLNELADYCEKNGFALVVDEAHATGLFGKEGRGLCEQAAIESKCFARMYTYGKAMGAHGAAIAGSKLLHDYLVNYCRPFIFSTSLPQESLLAIKAAYRLSKEEQERKKLFKNIAQFKKKFRKFKGLLPSDSPIQAIVIPGNDAVQKISDTLFLSGFDVRAVKSPTVKQGYERLRICLHSYNTTKEINSLFLAISQI